MTDDTKNLKMCLGLLWTLICRSAPALARLAPLCQVRREGSEAGARAERLSEEAGKHRRHHAHELGQGGKPRRRASPTRLSQTVAASCKASHIDPTTIKQTNFTTDFVDGACCL
jgi:hypothetical protein